MSSSPLPELDGSPTVKKSRPSDETAEDNEEPLTKEELLVEEEYNVWRKNSAFLLVHWLWHPSIRPTNHQPQSQ